MEHWRGLLGDRTLPEADIQIRLSENLTDASRPFSGIQKKAFIDKGLEAAAKVGMIRACILVSESLPNFNPRRVKC